MRHHGRAGLKTATTQALCHRIELAGGVNFGPSTGSSGEEELESIQVGEEFFFLMGERSGQRRGM